MLTSLSSSVLMLSLGKCSTMILRLRLFVKNYASLVNMSASSLSQCGTHYILKCPNPDFSFSTMDKYCFIRLSFAPYSPCTYPTTSWELLLTLTLLAPSTLARHSPVIIALYSTSLLVTLNLNLMVYLSFLFSSVTETTAHAALLVEKPSTCITHSS